MIPAGIEIYKHVVISNMRNIMLYGTEGEGRGRKSKYTVLPRGGRVQFEC